MIRWGVDRSGTQRWRCNVCNLTGIKRREDNRLRNTKQLFHRWLLGMAAINALAKQKGTSKRSLIRAFAPCWSLPLRSPFPCLFEDPIVALDGTRIAQDCVVLIAYDCRSDQPLGWSFVTHETYDGWQLLLLEIKRRAQPAALVSDGQKGLQKAIRELFPTVPHQRCLIHVIRLALAWLTRNPQTEAGQELRRLVCGLSQVDTVACAERWRSEYAAWDERHRAFLRERSVNPETGRAWYTHRKLRAVRSLIKGSNEHIFHFLSDGRIPSTTNCVEGGINALLKELIHRHRGLATAKKKVLVTHFLVERRRKNKAKLPTQIVT